MTWNDHNDFNESRAAEQLEREARAHHPTARHHPPTKTITIRCTWVSLHEVEVPHDYIIGGSIDDEWIDQVDSTWAELVDWDQQ